MRRDRRLAIGLLLVLAAFGVAVAMLEMKKEKDAQRVIWWGHPLTLKNPSGGAEEAEDLEKRAY